MKFADLFQNTTVANLRKAHTYCIYIELFFQKKLIKKIYTAADDLFNTPPVEKSNVLFYENKNNLPASL